MDVENLPVAVVAIDETRSITSANQALCELLAASPDELVGQNISTALRPRTLSGEDVLAVAWHPSAHLRSTRRINEQEIVVRRADGSEVEVMVDGAYDRRSNGELSGAVLMLRPRHRGARRPRSGVRIVSAVSHELRSPLTSVRGYTSLLMKRWDDISDDDRRQMLHQIDRDARRISRMIGELLDITRLETGRLQLNRVDLDAIAVVKDVLMKVEISWPDLQATLEFDPSFPRLNADADKVEQILTNLVENACKYASPQGLVIRGSTNGTHGVIEVADKGPGIPAADMPQLFKQFFHSKEGRPTGTGLGLWISRGLVEAHGGEMTAESRENVGTTFRFTLPRNTETLPNRLSELSMNVSTAK